MKQDSSTISWNNAGKEWAEFSKLNDYRIYFIMPYTFEKIGCVKGKKLLDIGCGEGGYSRYFAKNGAEVTGIDCSSYLIDIDKKEAENQGVKVNYFVANSNFQMLQYSSGIQASYHAGLF